MDLLIPIWQVAEFCNLMQPRINKTEEMFAEMQQSMFDFFYKHYGTALDGSFLTPTTMGLQRKESRSVLDIQGARKRIRKGTNVFVRTQNSSAYVN